MNKVTLKTILLVLPVISAGLYLLGSTYHQGYLDGFGLEESLFLIPTDRSLLFGFFSLLNLGIVPIVYSLLAAMLLIVATLVVAILASTERAKFWLIKIRELFNRKSSLKINPSENMVNLVDKGAGFYMYAAGIFLVMVILLLIALLSQNSGREQAAKVIKDFSDAKGNYVELQDANLSAPIKAKQIICGTSHCAFWIGDQAMVTQHEKILRLSALKFPPKTEIKEIKL